ncbi:hypothetical protein [Paenibacillus periandrae]|uniref:hypothetical protein n=1 Tax=Paenibacillus periandrae TaxID=1761741 RepID=UPI001F095AFF|nr:hypothetical protein [Paenibacillus periandrae]
MSKFKDVEEGFKQTLNTVNKKVKLKLDFNATARAEDFFTLHSFEVSEENSQIQFVVSDENQNYSVVYTDIESLDYADNNERLKIWVYFKNHGNNQRFYLYYKDSNVQDA